MARTPDAVVVMGRVRIPPPIPSALALSVFMEGYAMIPAAAYDPQTLGVLIHVFDEAWADLKHARLKALDPNAVRSTLAKRIMDAADKGEGSRSPQAIVCERSTHDAARR